MKKYIKVKQHFVLKREKNKSKHSDKEKLQKLKIGKVKLKKKNRNLHFLLKTLGENNILKE